MEKGENTSSEVAIIDKQDVRVTVANNQLMQKVFASGDIQALLDFCVPIAGSGISPFQDAKQVAAVALWAHSKDVNLIDALANTFVFNGRVSLNSHMVRGLLLKAGITHRVLKNAKPVYSYSLKDRVFTAEEVESAPEQFKVFYSMEAIKAYLELETRDKTITPIIRSKEPVDIVTEVEFTRYFPGRKTPVTYRSSFSFTEAQAAGLTEKSNWKAYLKLCLMARAYVIGAREIADDIIFGMYNPDELGFEGIETITLDEDVEYLESK